MNLYFVSSLLTITAVALLLRIIRLGRWSFWEDEIFSIQHALLINKEGIKAIDSPHPLYYLCIAPIFQKYGVSEVTARSVSAVIGSVSIPIFILLLQLQTSFGLVASLLFGALLAISPWHIYWSQNARFYTMTFLFQGLALLNLYQAVQTGHWSSLFFYLLFYSIATLAHETSLLTVCVVAVYLVELYLFIPQSLAHLTLVQIATALFAPPLLTGVVYLWVGGGLHKRTKTIKQQWHIHYGKRQASPLRILSGTLRYVGVPVVIVALVDIGYNFMHPAPLGLLAQTIMIVPLFVVLAGSFFAYAANRHMLLALFGFLLAACRLIDSTVHESIWLSLALVGVLLGTTLDDLFLYYLIQHGNRPKWKEVVQNIRSQITPSDQIYSTSPHIVQYYLKRYTRWLFEPQHQSLEQLPCRAWFVLDRTEEYLPANVQEWLHKYTRVVCSEEVRYHMSTWVVTVRVYEPTQESFAFHPGLKESILFPVK
ncbi:MAG: glycosyltransferase family 39 protein [Caldilineaceae bacterium]